MPGAPPRRVESVETVESESRAEPLRPSFPLVIFGAKAACAEQLAPTVVNSISQRSDRTASRKMGDKGDKGEKTVPNAIKFVIGGCAG